MRSGSSPLALVSRALVAERFDLVPGAGDGLGDDVFIRIAGMLVQQPRWPRHEAKHKRIRIGEKTKTYGAAPK
jgi:hypothetical protein